MAKPRYTARYTLRLEPDLRSDLEYEAAAKGDDVATLIRDILAGYLTRQHQQHGVAR